MIQKVNNADRTSGATLERNSATVVPGTTSMGTPVRLFQIANTARAVNGG